MPWYFLSGLYLVIWSALLIHCLMRRRLYPVFGLGWGTKVFWLLTFVFFNPLLTFLYFVFGFLLRPVKVRESGDNSRFSVSGVAVTAIAFVGFVLVLYEWPFAGYDARPVVIRSESQESNESFRGLEEGPETTVWRLGAQARLSAVGQGRVVMGKAKNGTQTFGSTSAQSGTSASVRTVMLICQNRHRLLDRAARQLQKSLVRLPDVDQVAYYPYGTRPEPGGILPDVFITVDTLEFHETAFLLSRRLKAIIQWKVGSTLFEDSIRHILPEGVPDPAAGQAVAAFHAESWLDHESTMVGIEGPLAKYKLEADGISAEMIKSISKQFASLLDKYGELPQAPQTLYGTYRDPPAFSFLSERAAERLISGHGLLKNNHTVWRFAETRGTDEALTAFRDEMKSSGWDCKELGKDRLWMRRGNEDLSIFQEHRRDAAGTMLDSGQPRSLAAGSFGVSMIAQYTSSFTDEQIQQAMDALLAGETEIKTLLAFERYFTPEQLERLRTIVEASPLCILDRFLMLGRYWTARGQMDKGRQCLLRARALLYAEKEPDLKSQEIRSLAKMLADESLADAPLSEDVLRDVGFVNAGQIAEPLKAERGPDEPLLLYRRLDNGQFHTFALRVIRSRDLSSPAPYVLQVVESREDRSSTSEAAGARKSALRPAGRPNNTWEAEFTLQNLVGEGKSMQLTVESVGDQRFLFVVRP